MVGVVVAGEMMVTGGCSCKLGRKGVCSTRVDPSGCGFGLGWCSLGDGLGEGVDWVWLLGCVLCLGWI